MLYLNGELVNTRLKADGTPADPKFERQALEYAKVIKEAYDYYGDTIIVETRQRPGPDPITGFMVFPGTRGILLTTNIITDHGSEEWVYSPNILKVEDGRLKVEVPNLLVHKGSYPVDVKRNPDLVYYLIKSNKVGRTIYENKKFHFKDTKAEHKHNAEERRLEGKVMNLVYSAIPEPNLRTLAKSWGVSGVNLKDIDSVREELYQLLVDGEKEKKTKPGSGRGFNEFIESSEVRFYDQVAALCKDAEESSKLVFDIEERRWLLEYGDGSSPAILKTLSGDEFGRPMDALVDFLVSERDQLRKIENVMGATAVKPSDVDGKQPAKVEAKSLIEEPTTDVPDNLTVELIENTKRMSDIKKLVKEHCPEYKGAKTDKAEELRAVLFRKVAESNIVQETAG